jgi:hypothetical protein
MTVTADQERGVNRKRNSCLPFFSPHMSRRKGSSDSSEARRIPFHSCRMMWNKKTSSPAPEAPSLKWENQGAGQSFGADKLKLEWSNLGNQAFVSAEKGCSAISSAKTNIERSPITTDITLKPIDKRCTFGEVEVLGAALEYDRSIDRFFTPVDRDEMAYLGPLHMRRILNEIGKAQRPLAASSGPTQPIVVYSRRTLVHQVPGHIASAAQWANHLRSDQRSDSITSSPPSSPPSSPKASVRRTQPPSILVPPPLIVDVHATAVHWV